MKANFGHPLRDCAYPMREVSLRASSHAEVIGVPASKLSGNDGLIIDSVFIRAFMIESERAAA